MFSPALCMSLPTPLLVLHAASRRVPPARPASNTILSANLIACLLSRGGDFLSTPPHASNADTTGPETGRKSRVNLGESAPLLSSRSYAQPVPNAVFLA